MTRIIGISKVKSTIKSGFDIIVDIPDESVIKLRY